MVIVAQLVRAPDCGSGGRGFEPHLSPNKKSLALRGFFWNKRVCYSFIKSELLTLSL